MFGHTNEPFSLARDVNAVIIPAGDHITLREGTSGFITQELGGSFTVYVEGNLFQIAGADADALRAGLAGLGVSGYALSLDRVTKQGFAATRFDVRLDEAEEAPHRGLADIVQIIERSRLSAASKERARRVFERL